MHRILLLGILFLMCHFMDYSLSNTIKIAGVFSSDEICTFFKNAVLKLNNASYYSGVQFEPVTIVMDPNPIRCAMSVCEDLISDEASAVIASHALIGSSLPYNDLSSLSEGSFPGLITDTAAGPLSFTCSYYNIPVIGITSRLVELSDKNVYSTLVRTVPPYFHQADIWFEILNYFSWGRIIFIHSLDEEGYAIYERFVSLTKHSNIKVEKTIPFITGMTNYTQDLISIKHLHARIILLSSSKIDAEAIFESAFEVGIVGEGYAWIVSEQALDAQAIPIGSFGIRLVNGTNERAHILDSLKLLAKSFDGILKDKYLTAPPRNCNESNSKWDNGTTVYQTLKETQLELGMTGHVSFDQYGDRKHPVYEVINVHSDGLNVVGIWGSSRVTQNHIPIYLIEKKLIFPGNTTKRPTSVEIVHHLNVLTIAQPPFLSAHKVNKNTCQGEDDDFAVLCYHLNSTTGEIDRYCCLGYSMDLLSLIAQYANFTFNATIYFEDYIGSAHKIKQNDTYVKQWDGLIGKLVHKKADIIAAPLTINSEHTEAITFSKPFKFQGLTILIKKSAKESSLGSFLQPFDRTLWILIMIALHAVALSLYVLDRFSPFGRYKLMKSDDTEDDALNFSSAIWFTWSVFFNSGVGEGTPRSFSARILGMVWAGFGMILIASYTANLAAFLVLDNRPEASISGIDDSRLRNSQDNYRIATIKKSAVNMFFKKTSEYRTLFEEMQKHNYDRVEDAINDVKNGDLQAFIWDHARLDYEASLDCSLMTLGDMFGSWQYGLGIRKDLYWIKPINDAISKLIDEDELERLNSKWLIERRVTRANCSQMDTVPATLGLTNMAGVFMLVAAGILIGLVLLLIEIGYKRHNRLRDKELELARNAADRWRSTVNKRRALRRAMIGEDIHRNSLCESLLRGVTSARSTTSSLPHTDSQPIIEDNSVTMQIKQTVTFST